MLLQTTKDLIEICNRIYPQLDIGKFSAEENKQLAKNIDLISEITQLNLDLMYPDRERKVTTAAAKKVVQLKLDL